MVVILTPIVLMVVGIPGFLHCFKFSEKIGRITTFYKLKSVSQGFHWWPINAFFPDTFWRRSTGKSVRNPKCGYFNNTWSHNFIIIHHSSSQDSNKQQICANVCPILFFFFFRNLFTVVSFTYADLVGGFNPFEKYARQIGSFPQF